MKKTLVLVIVVGAMWISSAEVSAVNYYVDATGGNDFINNGQSDATAWRTIGKVNSYNFQTGDDVFFKCGGAWERQALTVDWSGTADNRVVVGAYYSDGIVGISGDRPVISGTLRVNDSDEGAGYPSNKYTPLIMIQGDYITLQDVKTYRSGGRGIQVYRSGSSPTNIVVENCVIESAHMSGIIFYNLDGGEITNNIIVNVSRMALNPANGNWPAALVTHSGSRNLKINKNTVHSNHGEGIQTYDWAHDLIIEDNILYENAKAGFNITGPYPPNLNTTYNLVIRRNLIYGTTDPTYHRGGFPSTGIYLNDASNYSIYNIQIYDNLIAFCSIGVYFGSAVADPSHDIQVYNNTIIGCNYCIVSGGPNRCFIDVTIKNNIFAQWEISAVQIDNPEPGLNWSHNLWSSEPGNSECESESDVIGAEKLIKTTGWRDLTANELDGSEFVLQSTSPAIDKGANLGSPYNQGLNPASTWPDNIFTLDQDGYGDWEIGAYVFTGADINSDGKVDLNDVAVLSVWWDDENACSAPGWCGRADFDMSGTVDMSDLAYLAENWLR